MYNEIEAKLQFSSISAKLQTLFASIMHRLPACNQSQEKPKTGLQTETRQLLAPCLHNLHIANSLDAQGFSFWVNTHTLKYNSQC